MGKLYRIRKLTTHNSTGDAYGITIPRELNQTMSGISFSISCGNINIETEILENLNAAFKDLYVSIPSEYYPQLQFQKINLRNHLIEIMSPLRQSIVLCSGCDNNERKDSMAK
jgi:hypothetical protein